MNKERKINFTPEQEEAINAKGNNFLVSASAGSGKTKSLTERVYRLIKEEKVRLDQFLILTFTNDAASSMRKKIRERLFEEGLIDLANEVESSDIETFDAFALNLVKKYHLSLHVSPNILIMSEATMKIQKRKVIDSMLEEYALNNDPRLIDLIGKYVLKRIDPIVDLILSFDDVCNKKINRQEYLDNYLAYFYNEKRIAVDLKTYANFVIGEIKTGLLKLNRYGLNSDYLGDIENYLSSLIASSSFDELLENFKTLPSFPNCRKYDLSDEEKKIRDSFHKNLLTKYKKTILSIGNQNHVINQYFATQEVCKFIIEIVNKLDQKMNDFKRTNNAYTFDDIAHLASQALNKKEILKEVKEKYLYIMVDEYQDTSDIQENVIKMLENKNVFMVGDIKQSIYAFRNANAEIFLNKYNAFTNHKDGEKIDLKMNFRSRKEVIKDINDFFLPLMNNLNYQKDHIMNCGFACYENNTTKYQNNELDMYVYSAKTEDAIKNEAKIIASDILDKIKNGFEVYDKDEKRMRPVTYGDFTILIDRKGTFFDFKEVFDEYHIPLFINADAKIEESDLYLIVKNIFLSLSSIVSNNFNASFLHALASISRSFLIQEKDNEIYKHFSNKDYKNLQAFKILKKIATSIELLSISDLYLSILQEFNVLSLIYLIGNVRENYAVLANLYSLIKEMEMNGYSINDLNVFFADLENYDDVSLTFNSSSNDANSVSIMTIHKSKGLEFKIVYLPMLFKKFNHRSINTSFIADKDYGLLFPYVDNQETAPFYHKYLKYKLFNAEIEEKIRLFYVAMTRAEEKLIFLKNASRTKEILSLSEVDSFADLIEYVGLKEKEKIIEVVEPINEMEEHIDSPSLINVQNLNVDISEEIITRSSKNIDESVSSDLLQFGERIHYLLELTDFHTKNTSFIKDKKEKSIIDMFISRPLFNDLSNALIYKEFAFFDEKNSRNGVIDLLIIFDDHIKIIDYKLKNINDKEYERQLIYYKEYISQLSPKPIKMYLMSVLDNIDREVKDEPASN